MHLLFFLLGFTSAWELTLLHVNDIHVRKICNGIEKEKNKNVEVKYHRCQCCRKVKVKYQVRMEETNKYSASCKQRDADAGDLGEIPIFTF